MSRRPLERLRTKRWFAWAAHAPMVAFRLGLAPLVGRAFMVLTTTGRRSGEPRHTMVAFHEVNGRKYVGGVYGLRSQWYRNLQADPRVTVQTAMGTEALRARRITDAAELTDAFALLARRPLRMRPYLASQGLTGDPEDISRNNDRILLVTFEPTTDETPPPMRPDLLWVWPVAALPALLLALGSWRSRRRYRCVS